MTEPRPPSWLAALAEAARAGKVPLPPFAGHGMGSARTPTTADGRFVTVKRRLVPRDAADRDGVEFTLWRTADDLPVAEVAIREPAAPTPERVATVLALLAGWLLDGWTPEQATAAIGHPAAADR